MASYSTDDIAPPTAPPEPWAYESRARRSPRTDWRLGGRAVRRWRMPLLAIALFSLGAGVLLSATIDTLWSSPWAGLVSTAALWLAMLVPVVFAFSRSTPAGLLRFRAVDLLFGLGLALLLRVSQGWLEVAFGGMGALPGYPLIDGSLSATWLLSDALGVVVVAPVLEELLFRGVVLVVVYEALRRSTGRLTASVTAVAVSTALFVALHGVVGGASPDGIVSLALLGLVCGLLVVLTGRIWGAILVHVAYNATFVALALLGTFSG
jgi:membrane protease YdiL (CAAX protease family)